MLDEDLTATAQSPRFAKVLKRREVITLSFGAMIGWSWVLMTGLCGSSMAPLAPLSRLRWRFGHRISWAYLQRGGWHQPCPALAGKHIYTQRAPRIHLVFCLHTGRCCFHI